jgi:zinc/manganese transport system ATP-binding protein
MSDILTAKNLCFNDVFSDGNFALKSGSITALIGPNGSGKTTLLKLITGLLNPTSGSIEIHDLSNSDSADNVTDLGKSVPPKIGYVPQVYMIDRSDVITVYEFVKLSYLVDNNSIKSDAIKKILDLTGCNEFQNKRVSELSGGQKQRVTIAASLVIKPAILLLDEPFANLDIKVTKEIVALIESLVDALNLTVVLAIHDLNAVLKLVDGVIYLLDNHPHYLAVKDLEEQESRDIFKHIYGSEFETVRTLLGDIHVANDTKSGTKSGDDVIPVKTGI